MDHYLFIDNEQKGPYTLSQLKAMWITGTITKNTLYWQEGCPEWIPLSSILDLLEEPSEVPQPSIQHTISMQPGVEIAKTKKRPDEWAYSAMVIGLILIIATFFWSERSGPTLDSKHLKKMMDYYESHTNTISLQPADAKKLALACLQNDDNPDERFKIMLEYVNSYGSLVSQAFAYNSSKAAYDLREIMYAHGDNESARFIERTYSHLGTTQTPETSQDADTNISNPSSASLNYLRQAQEAFSNGLLDDAIAFSKKADECLPANKATPRFRIQRIIKNIEQHKKILNADPSTYRFGVDGVLKSSKELVDADIEGTLQQLSLP
jgi:hypothetical protein